MTYSGDQQPRALGDDILVGEDPGINFGRPFSRFVNRKLRSFGRSGASTEIYLGKELGDVPINQVRFRDAVEEGKLLAYIRQEASDPKVIIPTVIALGVVAAGLYMLQHNKKDKPGPEV